MSPADVAVDAPGNVHVANTHNQRIQKFDASSIFMTKLGSEGFGTSQFEGVAAVAIDAAANVYVADFDNNRIQNFKDATPPVVSCSVSPSKPLGRRTHELRAVTTAVTVTDGDLGLQRAPAGLLPSLRTGDDLPRVVSTPARGSTRRRGWC